MKPFNLDLERFHAKSTNRQSKLIKVIESTHQHLDKEITQDISQCWNCAFVNSIISEGPAQCINCGVKLILNTYKPIALHHLETDEVDSKFSDFKDFECKHCGETLTLKRDSRYFICTKCYETTLIKLHDTQKPYLISQIVNPYSHQKGIKTLEKLKQEKIDKEKEIIERAKAYKPKYYYAKQKEINDEKCKIFNPEKDYPVLHLEFERATKKIAERYYKSWDKAISYEAAEYEKERQIQLRRQLMQDFFNLNANNCRSIIFHGLKR